MSTAAEIRKHLRQGVVVIDGPYGVVELTSVTARGAAIFDRTGGISIDGYFVATDDIYYGKREAN